MISCRHILTALTVLIALGTASCFTGVESTPRINSSDVRKSKATTTPEQLLLADLKPERPKDWLVGKPFKIADRRISRIFGPGTDTLAGQTVRFAGISAASTLTSDRAAELKFCNSAGQSFSYIVPGVDTDGLDSLQSLDIPFTVDLNLVSRVDSLLRGRHLYIRTPSWYTLGSQPRAVNGLRHVEVKVDSVIAGDDNFPAAVCFTMCRPDMAPNLGFSSAAVLMSLGESAAASRNFDTLFAFENPRRRYPEIDDETWAYIICSRVRKGMSRDECRLALGAPPELLRTPTYGGMRERWSYSDGVFLIFDDGYLSKFRL